MMTTLPGDGTTKWNWVLYSIPESTTGLARNSSGVGILGVGSHGSTMAYEPPCSQGPGAKVYTFTLRSGIKFSDGTPVTANDVVKTLAVQWDAADPLHTGRSGAFDYWSGLFGGFLNPPPTPTPSWTGCWRSSAPPARRWA